MTRCGHPTVDRHAIRPADEPEALVPHRTICASRVVAAAEALVLASTALTLAPVVAPAHLLPLTAAVAGQKGLDLDQVGAAYGVRGRDLSVLGTSHFSARGGARRDVVRLQQRRGGMPVFAGQVVMVLDASGRVLSTSGETSTAGSAPAVTVAASAAELTARRAVARSRSVALADLAANRPTRWLLDPALLGGTQAQARATKVGMPRLRPVWRTTVTAAGRPDVRATVLVDAVTGRVSRTFSEVAALDRVICDDLRTPAYRCRSDAYDRVEGSGPSGIFDADQAYDLTGATATWFQTTLGVDLTAAIGNDLGDGRKLRSTTNFCPPGNCPLDNAFWSGDQMVYGAGYTSADDVVAHELTHGITQATAGLVYWYQSGAINESMSDVFGELVDQGDGVGSDLPTQRWQLGEDLPAAAGGVTRDMADPTRFGQPDSMTSTLYSAATDYDDSGAVHTNSGVPNKTAYLISDGTVAEPGGAFRGRAFAGIGTARTATLYWATLQMLTPAADFADLAAALRQACVNLAFTPQECAIVSAAVDATDLGRLPGPGSPTQVSITGGPGKVRLSWAPPPTAGSAPVTSYVVAVRPAVRGENFYAVAPDQTSFVLTGLPPGVDHVVRLVAVNAAGTSAPETQVLSGTALAITASPTVRFGDRWSVRGVLRNVPGAGLGGRRVRLLGRRPGSSAYDVVVSSRTRTDGTFVFPALTVARSTRRYVDYAGAATEIGAQGERRAIIVTQRVTVSPAPARPRAGAVLTLAGQVGPSRSGQVTLQRRLANGTWRAVARGPLGRSGYSVSWRLPDGSPVALRVRVPARPGTGLGVGLSRVLRLTPR